MKDNKMIKKIAKKFSKNNADHLIKTGEMPAIKLSNEEMRFLMGGTETPNQKKLRELVEALKNIRW